MASSVPDEEEEEQPLRVVAVTERGGGYQAVPTNASHYAGDESEVEVPRQDLSQLWALTLAVGVNVLLTLLVLVAVVVWWVWPALVGSPPCSLTLFASPSESPIATSSVSLYSRYREVCEANGVNVVWNRGDGGFVDATPPRNWTVNAATFAQSLPGCPDSTALLRAVALGQRKPLEGYDFAQDNLTGTPTDDSSYIPRLKLTVEWSRSYFAPHQCSPLWYTPDEICDVLHSYAYVLFLGDSMFRHVLQALFMLLTQDLQYGGIPRMSRQVGLYDFCRCDGQFSENALCRTYEQNNMFDLRDSRTYGVCTPRLGSPFQLGYELRYGGFSLPSNWDNAFCSADVRPRIIVVNGGVHYQYEIEKIKTTLLYPLFDRIQNATVTCAYFIPWRVIYLNSPAQSRVLDIKHPNQRRELVANFNQALIRELATLNVTVLDVWNLTRNAATSDGFHYLSDVNLQMAITIVNWLHFINDTWQAES